MSTSSFNFLEELPDVVFYAVLERLPGRVIENTVRLISRDCYRRVELRRGRLPRVYLDQLIIRAGSRFGYRREPNERARRYLEFDYQETIDPADLVQHLNHLKERATFKTLEFDNVNWACAANCKLQIECEELSCCVNLTTLSPEKFMDIFCSIRPTRKLTIGADNDIFPVTSEFFTNNYATRLQEVSLFGYGNAMVDPLNDTILLYSNLSFVDIDFLTSPGCTLDGIQRMLRDWYTSERRIDYIHLRAAGEPQNFWRNLRPLLVRKRFHCEDYIESIRALERANGDVIKLNVCIDHLGYLCIEMIRLVPGPKADLYRRYDDAGGHDDDDVDYDVDNDLVFDVDSDVD
ncbi:unnamed protein product, partial [Mesorhabditis belari]|uniref:F-box domain-containing protein n=1 Tax=Mesorhabditis belari TaxID=2138241 RepID=A0AAF3F6F5_9BILA